MYPSMHSDLRDNYSLHDLLGQCATNLTERAGSGDLSRAYGRQAEVDQVLTSLASPLKGRILVTGAARVGKTALIHEVAVRINAGDCPDVLKGSEVWGLSPRSILRAFGVRGWQERLGLLMEKWGSHPEVILFVDSLPSMMSAGATMEDPFDMAQFLLGQFQSSNSRILAEGRSQQTNTFLDAYPEYKHVLLEVRITEPDQAGAEEMVAQAVRDLQASQRVTVMPEAIQAAMDVTRRFALNEALPGKAIDLIGEGIALRAAEADHNPVVSEEDIIARFAEKTGLPRMLLTDEEPFDEEVVRRHFNDQVLGQEQAVDIIVQALSLLRTRLNNPSRPMGVFLFIGSTGVGKTELARVLARFLFGSDEVIVRFNMADYTQEWHVRTLFGDPHGYSMEGRRGQLTTRLQDKAFAVILLDEFEKAHPEVFQRYLQLFDEGVLINGASEVVNLRNSIVILTSNFGAQMLEAQRIGFGPNTTLEEQEQQIREEMVRFFSPEFINRIDSVCFFKPLTKPVLREIAYRRVQEILQREGVQRRDLQVEVDENVIEWVVEHGYSERYGARYLARQIEKTITYPLAQQVIRNDPPDNSTVRLFLHHNRIASALDLPATDHSTDIPEDGAALVDPNTLPARLTLAHMNTGLPLLRERIEALTAAYQIEESREQLSTIMREMSTPVFWSDPSAMQPRLQSMSRLAAHVELGERVRRNFEEMVEYLRRVEEESRPDLLSEAALRYRYLVRELPRAELALYFSHPWDKHSALVNVRHKGRREVARTWAIDLVRMYLGWAARRDLNATVFSEDLSSGGSGVWLAIDGYGVYGLLRGEAGVHRLVQPADDDSDSRQIVQAVVSVYPEVPAADGPPFNTVEDDLAISEADRETQLIEHGATQVELPVSEEDTMTLITALPSDEIKGVAARVSRSILSNGTDTANTVRIYDRYSDYTIQDPRTGETQEDFTAVLGGAIDPFITAMLTHEEGSA